MKYRSSFLLYSALALLSACSSKNIQINPTTVTYCKEDFIIGKAPIAIPPNTNQDRYGNLVLAVDFKDYIPSQPGAISKDSVETLSTRLQTDLALLKRFKLFSIHNRGGVRTIQRLADIGEANAQNIEERDMPPIDYVLTASIVATKKIDAELSSRRKRVIVYEVEVNYSVEDLKTKTILPLPGKARGRCLKRQILSARGKQIRGFRDDDPKAEKAAMYYAGMKAIEAFAHKLGHALPVGGRVTDILPSGRFNFEKGAKDGIGSNSQIVLYAKKHGITIGLGVAEADVETRCTTCVPYKWNDSNVDALPIIKAIKSGTLSKEIELYAVQYGMPIPEEWNNAYQ